MVNLASIPDAAFITYLTENTPQRANEAGLCSREASIQGNMVLLSSTCTCTCVASTAHFPLSMDTLVRLPARNGSHPWPPPTTQANKQTNQLHQGKVKVCQRSTSHVQRWEGRRPRPFIGNPTKRRSDRSHVRAWEANLVWGWARTVLAKTSPL